MRSIVVLAIATLSVSATTVGHANQLPGRSDVAGSAPETIWSLRQLSVTVPPALDPAAGEARLEQFRAATQTIVSCADADRVAVAQGAEVVSNESVADRALPPVLRSVLASTPDGRATPLFGERPVARVLVVCARHPAR